MYASLKTDPSRRVIRFRGCNRRGRPTVPPREFYARLANSGRRADYAYFVKYPKAQFTMRTTLSEEAMALLELNGQIGEPWCSDELLVVSAFIAPARTVVRRFIVGEKWAPRMALQVRTEAASGPSFGCAADEQDIAADFFASRNLAPLIMRSDPLKQRREFGRCAYQDSYFGPDVFDEPAPFGGGDGN